MHRVSDQPSLGGDNNKSKVKEQEVHGHGYDWSDIRTNWDTTEEWTYVGHGEWVPPENGLPQGVEATGTVQWDPEWVYKWRCTSDKDLQNHIQVLEEGYPNRWGARIPIETKWNLDLFEQLLEDYDDKEVVEWMKFGWPSGRLPTLGETSHQ